MHFVYAMFLVVGLEGQMSMLLLVELPAFAQ